jgi:hypothetical protein
MKLTKEDAIVTLNLLKRVSNVAFEETEIVALLRQKYMKIAEGDTISQENGEETPKKKN